MTNILLLTN